MRRGKSGSPFERNSSVYARTPTEIEQCLQGAWYQALGNRINIAQRRRLRALARHPTANVFSAEYVREERLPSVSTVQTSLEALEKTELIEQGSAGWQVANPLLDRWLAGA